MQKIKFYIKMKVKNLMVKKATMVAVLVTVASSAFAQGDGVAGIEAATQEAMSYFEPIANLCMVIGAIMGVIGGVGIYNRIQSGDRESGKGAAAWLAGAAFLVLVPVVLKAFFGI